MRSMMKRTTLREIKQSLGRYLAIMAIVALGVGFFAGLKVTTAAMIETGDNFLEDELNNDLLILGISHLLAISGLHITILVNLFVKLLDKLFYFERPKEIIVTIFLLIYIVITNF